MPALGVEVVGWGETDDPYAVIAAPAAAGDRRSALANRMWAEQVLRFRTALPGAEQRLASDVLARAADAQGRRRGRRAAPRRPGHRPGARPDGASSSVPASASARSAATIAAAILAEGHETVDFVIVGSGPNGASPHHEVGDRVLAGRRPGRRRHRRHDGRGLLLGLHPDVLPRRAAGRLRRVLRGAARRPAGGLRAGPARGHRRVGRRGRPRGHRGRRLRRGVRPPHRSRHRRGDPRGALHRRRATTRLLEPGWRSRSSRASTSPGRHGARIEDIVVATEDGVERLNLTDPRPRRAGGLTVAAGPAPVGRRPRAAHRRGPRAARADPRAGPRGAGAEGGGVRGRERASRARCSAPSARPACSACPTPRSYGGGGQPYEVYLQVVEELATVWATVAEGVSVHTLACFPLAQFGTDEQRDRWLPDMVGGELLGAYCLSEPQSGSDAAALVTRAVRDGDDYVVNGTKAWITHGGEADFYALMCRTSDDGARGISCLLVDAETPGVSAAAPEHKMGFTGSTTAQMRFDGARIAGRPADGRRGRGLQDRARRAGRRPPRASRPARSGWLRRRWTRPSPGPRSGASSAGRSSTSRASASCSPTWPPRSRRPGRCTSSAARRRDRGQPFGKQAAMAKLFCTDTAMRVTTDAVQVLRRLRLRRGLPGRALHARGQGAADRRGHQPDPADGHRPPPRPGVSSGEALELPRDLVRRRHGRDLVPHAHRPQTGGGGHRAPLGPPRRPSSR